MSGLVITEIDLANPRHRQIIRRAPFFTRAEKQELLSRRAGIATMIFRPEALSPVLKVQR